jgi:hypothetical protein
MSISGECGLANTRPRTGVRGRRNWIEGTKGVKFKCSCTAESMLCEPVMGLSTAVWVSPLGRSKTSLKVFRKVELESSLRLACWRINFCFNGSLISLGFMIVTNSWVFVVCSEVTDEPLLFVRLVGILGCISPWRSAYNTTNTKSKFVEKMNCKDRPVRATLWVCDL